MKYIFIVITMLSLASCGKNNPHESGTNTLTVTSAEEIAEITSAPGIYELIVSSLNPVKFRAAGTIIQDENEITVSVSAKRAFPFLSISQTIYEGDCPTSADDRNSDGFIDHSEAESQLGRILVPLETTRANLFGRYSLKTVMNKLQIQSDIQKRHGAVKIDWEKAVVLFQKAQTDENLPVACAKISLK